MTRLVILLCIFISQTSNSQIVVNDSLDIRYHDARTLMHPYLQCVLSHWDTLLQNGVTEDEVHHFPTFVTTVSIDTLNKENVIFKDLTGIEIISINGLPYDDSAYSEQEEWAKIFLDIWLSTAYLKEDTLYIDFGMPLSEESVQFEIIDSNIKGSYREWYKYDKILKQIPNDTLTNDLTLPIKFEKIIMSSTTYEEGSLIFGYATISVPPYYISESSVLNGPLYLQKKYEMYFKFRIAQ